MNDLDFSGINIVNLPSIPVKSIIPGEFLVNKIDFNNYLENILKEKGKKVVVIDCQYDKKLPEIIDNNQLILIKNVHEQSFSNIIKQIRRKLF